MTNTKWLSALLAGTALTVASTAAMADTSLITMKRNLAGEGVTFSISPTADMPAAATEVTISGEVRGRALNSKVKGADSTTDMDSRARVIVKAKTETAVGTVGAYVRLEQSNGSVDGFDSGVDKTANTADDKNTDANFVNADKAYGYWQMTPEWQLLVGRTDSISAIEAGIDWNFNGSLVGNVGGPTNSTEAQVRLTYGSGPFTWAVAIEDSSPGTAAASNASNYAIGSALKFAAGSGIDFSLTGLAVEDSVGSSSDYFLGAGANFELGSVATATVAAGMGEGKTGNSYLTVGADEAFSNASVGLTFGVSETTSLELGYGYTDADLAGKASDITAALLWSPVSQMTLGAGIGYEDSDVDGKTTSAGLGAWFKF